MWIAVASRKLRREKRPFSLVSGAHANMLDVLEDARYQDAPVCLETTTDFALNEQIQNNLYQKLKEDILPGKPFEIDMQWSGIMAFGPNKFPEIIQASPRVYGAFRMGGMGVAMGSAVAKELMKYF